MEIWERGFLTEQPFQLWPLSPESQGKATLHPTLYKQKILDLGKTLAWGVLCFPPPFCHLLPFSFAL